MTDALEASTTIHAPRADVYALLRDVEGFDAYSDHVADAVRYGNGDVGAEYDVTLSWWKLSYTTRFRVAGLDPPERVEWRLTEDLEASVVWRLEPADVDDPAVENATHVVLLARSTRTRPTTTRSPSHRSYQCRPWSNGPARSSSERPNASSPAS